MVKIPRQRGRLLRLLSGPAFCDVIIALGALLAVGLSTVPLIDDNRNTLAWVAIFVGVAIFLAAVRKACLAWKKEEPIEATLALEGCLHTIHSLLLAPLSSGENDKLPRLRLTIHVPIRNGRELEQVLDYVGGKANSTAGRRFAVQSGIIGAAYRERKVFWAVRQNSDAEEYVRELVSTWGYTEKDAEARDKSVMAWMAIPLFDEDAESEVAAIVYLDSNDVGFFNDDGRRDLIQNACTGISRFLKSWLCS